MKRLAILCALGLAVSACVTPATDGSEAGSTSDDTENRASPSRAMAGVAIDARVPTDVRRATFIVRDMDRSLAFWQGALGLETNYDVEVTLSGVNLPLGEPGTRARLVLLNGNDPYIGWIGLMQPLDPALPDVADPYPTRLSSGSVVMVVNVDDAEARCALAAQVPGTLVTGPARLQVYPGRGEGAPDIRVMGCNVFDPDGTAVEINQLLD